MLDGGYYEGISADLGGRGPPAFASEALFAFPEESLEAAREGITLCLDVLIPLSSLFVLSSPAHRNRGGWFCARPLSRWMYPLFGVGRFGAAALVLG